MIFFIFQSHYLAVVYPFNSLAKSYIFFFKNTGKSSKEILETSATQRVFQEKRFIPLKPTFFTLKHQPNKCQYFFEQNCKKF